MKKISTFLLTLVISCTLLGQNQQVIDSLLVATEKVESKQDQIDLLNQVALEYSGLDTAKVAEYTSRTIELAIEIGYEEGLIDAWYVIGRGALLQGDYTRSENFIAQVIDQASNINYQKGLANGFFAKGWLFYYRGNYDQSISHHRKALAIREDLGDKLDLANSLRGLGITFKLQGDFDHALYYLNQSLAYEDDLNNRSGIAECLNHIGIINSLRGDYSSAMENYLEALESQQTINDKSGLAYTYQNIGMVHFQQENFDKTLEYFQQSLDLRKEIGETRGIAQITYNLGETYHQLGQFDTAFQYYTEALEIKEAIGDQRGVADGHLNIGRLYADQQRYREAIQYQLRSLEISQTIDSDWGKVNALIGLGRSYHEIDDNRAAKRSLLEGIEIATSSKLPESLKEAAGLLSRVEESLGHYQDAYEAQRLYQKMADSLSSEEVTKKITMLEAEFQFRQVKDSIELTNNNEKALLDQKISAQQNIQIIAFIAVIILLGSFLILYRYYHLKNASNKKLTSLNDEIRKSNVSLKALNEEKNNLIGIVAHDLQNPLSNIINAVDLIQSGEQAENQDQLTDIIKVTSGRMHKMISEILNVEEIEKSAEDIQLQAFNLSPVVSEVCSHFTKAAAAKDLQIETYIEEDVVALVDDRYVIQVIENLLSNAIKFSPPGKSIEVRLVKEVDNCLLEVKDHGPGLSDADKSKLFRKFQRLSAKPTANESSTGLGLSIVKRFVEQMQGKIWCESRINQGASFFVELSLSGGPT